MEILWTQGSAHVRGVPGNSKLSQKNAVSLVSTNTEQQVRKCSSFTIYPPQPAWFNSHRSSLQKARKHPHTAELLKQRASLEMCISYQYKDRGDTKNWQHRTFRVLCFNLIISPKILPYPSGMVSNFLSCNKYHQRIILRVALSLGNYFPPLLGERGRNQRTLKLNHKHLKALMNH